MPPTRASRLARLVLAATGVGLLTGFFGVGGGFAIVPALVLVLGYSMPVAVGTSLLVISLNSASALAIRTDLRRPRRCRLAGHRLLHARRRARQPPRRPGRPAGRSAPLDAIVRRAPAGHRGIPARRQHPARPRELTPQIPAGWETLSAHSPLGGLAHDVALVDRRRSSGLRSVGLPVAGQDRPSAL
ncbi:MAG: TSUP family transporter [Dermatophilaceae bacterium]